MNTFGRSFRITTFGESHGPVIGVVIDGCPAGLPLSVSDIQPLLDRRRPGTSPITSPRAEPDQVEILSGVFEGKTTGMPVAQHMLTKEHISSDIEQLQYVSRHHNAEITYKQKNR